MKRRNFAAYGGNILVGKYVCGRAAPSGQTEGIRVFQPNKSEGNSDFDFPSNSFSADVKLDGFLDDERWAGEDVISLGSWNDADAESGEYGRDRFRYRRLRALEAGHHQNVPGETVGFHFGFEVKDDDVAYLSP